jgi:hypothetical protein
MPLPEYLYHATSNDTAKLIMASENSGLEPRSGGEDEEKKYLCMSASEKGAITLQNRANDIIFRVKGEALDADLWKEAGAGKQEWRGKQTILKGLLEYRRSLGNADQKKWKESKGWPKFGK